MRADERIPTDLTDAAAFLSMVGTSVRAARSAVDLTRKQLSAKCGVSERHLAQVETGKGNISIRLLRQIAHAVDLPVEALVRESAADDGAADLLERTRTLDRYEVSELVRVVDDWIAHRQSGDKHGRIALIGLKGAGKSTVGARTATLLGIPFVELDDEITNISGLTVEEIFSMYGEQRYRELERECLERVARDSSPFVLAVAGGIVSSKDTYGLLLDRFHTVWLTAEPEEHMGRVVANGDRRPVDGNPDAMDNLRTLLASREPYYQHAHHRLDTSGKSISRCCEELEQLVVGIGDAA